MLESCFYIMNRPVVEFPLFYDDEREDVREFLGNYRRAGLLNGWDEEKLALGLPLFVKNKTLACSLKL